MNIEELKKQADERINTASAILSRDKVYFPMLFAVDEEGSTLPVSLTGEDANKPESQEEIEEIMKVMAETSVAMYLILDMNIVEFDEKPAESEMPIPGKIKDDPRSVPALVVFIHTKDKSYMKQIRYKMDNDDVLFFNFNWEVMDEITGKYDNPYKKK